MPTVMPGTKYEPLEPRQGQPKMKAHDLICIHTMVGSLRSTDNYFEQNGWGGTESHFGTGYDGEIIQWQDTEFTADANYKGGWHVISIENADTGTGFPKWNTNDGSQVPPFTPAQIEANASIIAWACKKYNIPCELVPDSKVGRRGICYHRQGVPRKKTDTVSQTGGELWSTAPGKACPGDKRIAQIPQIIRRAKELLNSPPQSKGPFMSLSDAEQRELLEKVRAIHGEQTKPLDYNQHHGNPKDNQFGQVLSVRKMVKQLTDTLGELRSILDSFKK